MKAKSKFFSGGLLVATLRATTRIYGVGKPFFHSKIYRMENSKGLPLLVSCRGDSISKVVEQSQKVVSFLFVFNRFGSEKSNLSVSYHRLIEGHSIFKKTLEYFLKSVRKKNKVAKNYRKLLKQTVKPMNESFSFCP